MNRRTRTLLFNCNANDQNQSFETFINFLGYTFNHHLSDLLLNKSHEMLTMYHLGHIGYKLAKVVKPDFNSKFAMCSIRI